MRRPTALSLLSLILTVLLVAVSGTCQTATAQQPALDLSAPVTSLEEAVRAAKSDSALVDLAVAFQTARADTEISFGEYRKGVHLFRTHHPGFYGNFFGDPLYATYDREYQDLTWERQLAEPDINPANSIRNDTWFFCLPSTYDPAFNGECRGLTFAASNFSQLPFFLAHRQSKARTTVASAAERRASSTSRPPTTDRGQGVSPSDPDTLMRGPAGNGSTDEGADASIQVPDEAASQMQRRALELRQVELRQRVREMIEEEYGGREALKPEERADLANRLSKPTSASGRPSGARRDRDRAEQHLPPIERGTPTERGNLERRLEDIRDRLEERDRPSPGRTAPSHRSSFPESDADPSPGGTGGSGGSSGAGSSSTNRSPPSPERDGSGGER